MASSPKIPLLDPLGLPVSPEAIWESVETALTGGMRAATEIATETFEIVSGRGLNMKGSIEDFQEGKAKSSELVKEENEARELGRKRAFFATLIEGLQNAQNYAHTTEIDALTVEAATLGTEERNELLGHQVGLDRKHTENAYSISSARRALIEQRKGVKQQTENAPIPSPAKQASALETQFEGGSGKMGSGTASLSSASGAVG